MAENPSAFPGGNVSTYDGKVADGMTLRQWYAGQALIGLLAHETEDFSYGAEAAADRAFAMADAMMILAKQCG